MALTKGSINLLTASIQPQGRWDRIYEWTVNTAKYIIILTEVVVLFAIGVRFALDGRINDLDKEIQAQKAILDGRAQEDLEIRALSSALNSISRMEKTDYTLTTYYKKIIDLIPPDINVNNVSVNINVINLTGKVETYDKLLILENNLRSADFISDATFSTSQQSNGNIIFSTSFKVNFKENGSQ